MRHLPTTRVVCEKLCGGNRDAAAAVSPLPAPQSAPARFSARAGILTVSLLSLLGCSIQLFAQTPTPTGTPAPAATAATATATPRTASTAAPSPDAPQTAAPNATATPAPNINATPAPNAPAATPVPGATPNAAAPADAPRVVGAYRLGADTQPPGGGDGKWKRDSMTAGLNNIVVVEVSKLEGLLNKAKCLDKEKNKIANCRERNILLFIEGRPLKGMTPESGAPELTAGGHGTLRYHLQRPPETETANYADSKEHWADLLGLNNIFELFVPTRDVSLSVGLEDEYPIGTDITGNNKFHLLRADQMRLILWAILLLACLYIFYRLARESDIIRDRKPVLWKQRKPYSLSQTQAAWWFFFVVIGFIFIWLVTGQRDLSSSVLVLLGIGFATAIGSTVIDRSRTSAPLTEATAQSSDLTTLIQQKDALEAELTDLEMKLKQASDAGKPQAQAAFDAKQGEYADKIKEIRKKFPDALGWHHTDFHIDILSDAGGVNFHRFQMVVWTVVLGIVFIHQVLSRLSMPEFSTTLLTLMGISNGTYLIGKSSEPQGAPAAQPAGATGGGAGNTPAG